MNFYIGVFVLVIFNILPSSNIAAMDFPEKEFPLLQKNYDKPLLSKPVEQKIMAVIDSSDQFVDFNEQMKAKIQLPDKEFVVHEIQEIDLCFAQNFGKGLVNMLYNQDKSVSWVVADIAQSLKKYQKFLRKSESSFSLESLRKLEKSLYELILQKHQEVLNCLLNPASESSSFESEDELREDESGLSAFQGFFIEQFKSKLDVELPEEIKNIVVELPDKRDLASKMDIHFATHGGLFFIEILYSQKKNVGQLLPDIVQALKKYSEYVRGAMPEYLATSLEIGTENDLLKLVFQNHEEVLAYF